MVDLVWKFRRAGLLVMNSFVGACSTVKACKSPDHHRKFVGCNEDCEFLIAAALDLVLTFTSQVIDPKSDTTGSGEVKAVEKVFTDKNAALLPTKKVIVWKALSELELGKCCWAIFYTSSPLCSRTTFCAGCTTTSNYTYGRWCGGPRYT